MKLHGIDVDGMKRIAKKAQMEDSGPSPSLHQELVDAGIPVENHESDLYFPVTPETQAIVESSEFGQSVETFTDNIDGEQWFDAPFQYDPSLGNKMASEKEAASDDETWDKLDLIRTALDDTEIVDNLIKGLSSEEANSSLDYIIQMYDLSSEEGMEY